ncbi:putative Ribosomal protein l7/l12-like protein60S ribosomal protein [Leptomonas pyrrhocoris]|uniref:Putative Ribosomal protein l7/l12-like protein60S ribosomal protein n=1 Tax=Leptomonas pyrrhocoris TaxID=157538 RepID=A0A0N0VD94_LEPPY|nr:putative Ribosomal protein l7/l12-like protein60S ribosomal protein [Leptomonas pyrrhocoris]XP_015652972.1 putative Ribosomal protein l7/l12-like protein60S ribosomal protein [Leptomonas pyrrhocoris]KPA74532.1 putative Ribosomal protein l7/l12-like protein60S ribosomal protein [Leptomonas pyrrhocoris]KPA74533.1 putative Ribosomal protein l7/l12-like protein60S ribosomal protein [Leptomonas pyrrhocoris]|eukprot:XP_015652971.1 putative Ribosomal protein l7/l12-like protein60S ribosomal protein [Leptomonas pyrrhocoris]
MMLGRALVPRRGPTMTNGPLMLAQRTLISGMASNRIPRGMAPLAVRDSAEVVEQLADAYVNMDLATMGAFHRKAMAEMLRGNGGTAAAVNYEEQLLQTMGGGGGGGAAAPVAAAAPAVGVEAASGASAATSSSKKAAEKSAFDITLKKYPPENKIKLIKELRAACGLGIQEAKSAIEKCPGVIARHMQTADAEKLKATMVKLGAEVELT